ncbi:Putative xanthine dehydrogenase YagT iron-sulfur-binding subunit [Streptomyces hundungensis]|uniref:Xanthine dehydrogenase YagT iron-sulfur-binding subunit n=1 Tax=Streptomyces hundungensis TaxID=1077946 RepID=A0A387HL39_9ACTN|nr:2Fe-2S iron-sulfur cluster-binding protein [Streptomyces hundungensis]AYG84585.1 Putative xanthine dehydrogenase YagT iron-sulfur-binding subunit [Streptomyces hundungensis]
MEARHGRQERRPGLVTRVFGHGVTDSHVTLRVNDAEHRVELEHCATLLEVLRENLGLTASRKGCDDGRCGECTVLLDGRRVNSCLLLAVAQEGREIVTVEGLVAADADDDRHPLRRAVVDRDVVQCAYCAPDQHRSAAAGSAGAPSGPSSVVTDIDLPPDAPVRLTAAEVRDRLSGNLCRCGAYPSGAEAVQDVIV